MNEWMNEWFNHTQAQKLNLLLGIKQMVIVMQVHILFTRDSEHNFQ